MIEKNAQDPARYRKPLLFYNSARESFQDILSGMKSSGPYTLLLPGYIGYSPREGSGLYDPVTAEKVPHLFYRIDRSVRIDPDDFRKKLYSVEGNCLVLLVHYFGYVDPAAARIAEMCRERNAVLVEDSAHALYTDLIDHACGSLGDYCFYSLHKMLPFRDGGML